MGPELSFPSSIEVLVPSGGMEGTLAVFHLMRSDRGQFLAPHLWELIDSSCAIRPGAASSRVAVRLGVVVLALGFSVVLFQFESNLCQVRSIERTIHWGQV